MLANTKSEFKRSLATLYPAIKAKLVCVCHFCYYSIMYGILLVSSHAEMFGHSATGRGLHNPGGYHSNNVEQHAGATPTQFGQHTQEGAWGEFVAMVMMQCAMMFCFQLREQSASELCCDIKAWGSCKKLGCSYVHNISHITSTHMIPPHIKLPSTGTVKVSNLLDRDGTIHDLHIPTHCLSWYLDTYGRDAPILISVSVSVPK